MTSKAKPMHLQFDREMETEGGQYSHPGYWSNERELIDHLALPALILSATCELVHANAAAAVILGEHDGLESVNTRLETADRNAAQLLVGAVERACVADSSAGWEIVHVPRASGRRPFALCVARLILGERNTVAILYILDATRSIDLDPELLRAIYGFSASEARVAASLVSLGDLEEVAAALCLSVHTVRTHLKSILATTGAHRQSELVRILVSGPGALAFGSRNEITPNERCAERKKRVASSRSKSNKQGRVR